MSANIFMFLEAITGKIIKMLCKIHNLHIKRVHLPKLSCLQNGSCLLPNLHHFSLLLNILKCWIVSAKKNYNNNRYTLLIGSRHQLPQFQQFVREYWLAPLLPPFCNLLWGVQLDSFSSRCMVLQSGCKCTDISKGKYWELKFQTHDELFHLHFSSGCWLFFHEPWSCSLAQSTTNMIWRRQSVQFCKLISMK